MAIPSVFVSRSITRGITVGFYRVIVNDAIHSQRPRTFVNESPGFPWHLFISKESCSLRRKTEGK